MNNEVKTLPAQQHQETSPDAPTDDEVEDPSRTVTDADLHYVGSITIDRRLMDAADLLEYEQVAVVDLDNGARLETYVIAGPRMAGTSA